MFCPKCATQNVDGASFCRACGANISLVPQALSGQLPSANQTRRDEYVSRVKSRRQPSLENAVRSLTMGVAFAAIAVLISKFGPGGSTWWFWLLIPAASLFAKGFSQLARLRQDTNQPPAVPQPQLNTVRLQDLPAQKTGELMTPVPSVTEGTTRHLNTEPPTRHFDAVDNQKPS